MTRVPGGVVTGEIVHVELPSRDFARSSAFYGALFGWKSESTQAGGHLRFEPPGGIAGSWVRDALAQAPGPVPFVAVTDVDKTLAQAEKQGGRILVQRLTLPGRGTFGLLADADGNVIGVLAMSTTAAAPAVARSDEGQTSPAGSSGKAGAKSPKESKDSKDAKESKSPAASSKGAKEAGTAARASATKKAPPRKR